MQTRSLICLVVVGVVFSVFSADGSRAEIVVHEAGMTLPASAPSPYQCPFADLDKGEAAIGDFHEDVPPGAESLDPR